jgi:hypothetical protein
MPFDVVYEELLSAYLDLSKRYSKTVDDLIALHQSGDHDHSSFEKAALLTQDLAAQVKVARDRTIAHRRASANEVYR